MKIKRIQTRKTGDGKTNPEIKRKDYLNVQGKPEEIVYNDHYIIYIYMIILWRRPSN